MKISLQLIFLVLTFTTSAFCAQLEEGQYLLVRSGWKIQPCKVSVKDEGMTITFLNQDWTQNNSKPIPIVFSKTRQQFTFVFLPENGAEHLLTISYLANINDDGRIDGHYRDAGDFWIPPSSGDFMLYKMPQQNAAAN